MPPFSDAIVSGGAVARAVTPAAPAAAAAPEAAAAPAPEAAAALAPEPTAAPAAAPTAALAAAPAAAPASPASEPAAQPATAPAPTPASLASPASPASPDSPASYASPVTDGAISDRTTSIENTTSHIISIHPISRLNPESFNISWTGFTPEEKERIKSELKQNQGRKQCERRLGNSIQRDTTTCKANS